MCTFNVPFTGDSTKVISKANQQITAAGGTFTANSATDGSFSISNMLGSVEGNYTVMENTLQINITNKPMFLSCSKIESLLKERLQG